MVRFVFLVIFIISTIEIDMVSFYSEDMPKYSLVPCQRLTTIPHFFFPYPVITFLISCEGGNDPVLDALNNFAYHSSFS